MSLLLAHGCSWEDALGLVGSKLSGFERVEQVSVESLSKFLSVQGDILSLERGARRRARLRRYGNFRTALILVGFLLLCRYSLFNPVFDLFRGMNLTLPLPTKWFLEPGLLFFAVVLILSFFIRNRKEERWEAEARHCHLFRAKLALGWDVEQISYRLNSQSCSPGFRALIKLTTDREELSSLLRKWSHVLEWDLSWHHYKRRKRWWIQFLTAAVFEVNFVFIAIFLPFYQLTGHL